MVLLLSVLLLAALLLTSCGSMAKESASGAAESGYAVPDSSYNSGGLAAPAPASAGDYMTEDAEAAYGMEEAVAEGDYGMSEDWDDSDMEPTAYDDVAEDGTETAKTTEAAPETGNGTGTGTDEASKKNLEKIVYTCSADLQTLEYDESVKALKEAVRSSGGIIQSETESNNNNSWYYDSTDNTRDNRNLYLTVRIPTEKYETFVDSLDQYGQVMSKSQSAENISRTYNDKKTYITSLETEQKRLLEMMDKAETIEDMMAVEERLTEVQRQLNQYKTQLDAMDMDVAYSTVTLSVQEVQKITNQPTSRDSFGTRIKKAFIAAWEGFVSFWEDFLFALIYLLPAIVVIGLIVWIILRATRRKRKARKEQKRAEKEMFEDLKRRAEEEKAKQAGFISTMQEATRETAQETTREAVQKTAQETMQEEQHEKNE